MYTWNVHSRTRQVNVRRSPTATGSFRGSDRIDLYSATKRMSVISEGIPKRIGGPQYPVPRLT